METTGRRRKRNTYVTIENSMFHDSNISWKAKGILGYLLTKPDGWKVRVKDLMKNGNEGERAIRSGLKELQEFGYLAYYRTRENGTFSGIVWIYDDVPFKKDSVENLDIEPFEPELQNSNVEEIDHNVQNAVVETVPMENGLVQDRPDISKELTVSKKDFNKFDYDYQSIIMPNVLHAIEKVFANSISDDGLIDIVNSYYVFHEKLTILDLQQILRAMRDSKNKIKNVEAYLYKSFANAIRQSETAQIQAKEPIRKEILPDWFNEEQQRRTGVSQAEDKKRVQERLENLRTSNKKNDWWK
jgi:hypothetical protein